MKAILFICCFIFYTGLAKGQVVAMENEYGSTVIAGNKTPLIIAVEGYPSSALVVTADNGTVTGSNGQYSLTPAIPDSVCTIHVSVKIKGHLKEVKQMKMTVECLKIEKVGFAGKSRGNIPLEQAQAGTILYCSMGDYDFAVPAYVINCTVVVMRDGKEIFNKTITNKTEVHFEGTEVADMLKAMKRGDKLLFKKVVYRTLGNCTKSVADLDFTII